MWAAKDNGKNINWTDAKKYCESYRGGGYTNWRMPTQHELEVLCGASKVVRKTDCGFDIQLTKLIGLSCVFAWSADTFEADEAASVYFSPEGPQVFMVKKSTNKNYRALPVRSK
jgi:formylglycine-generating enzyme required for sulfatase activity